MDDLLKEAIADAKAVRETALENAKMALEEAFTPRLQSMLSKKIQTELEDDDMEDEMDDLDDDADSAMDDVKEAAEDTGDAIENAANETGDAIEKGAKETGDAVKKGAQEVEDEVEGNDDM